MNVNTLMLGGNLTRDPELRHLAGGKAIADFGIAYNRKWTGKDGEKKEDVSFFNCTAFENTAENIAQYFKKGDGILIQGELKQDQWEDKETGQKKTAVKVIAHKFHFVGGKRDDTAPRTQKPSVQPSQNREPAVDADAGGYQENDDVPF